MVSPLKTLFFIFILFNIIWFMAMWGSTFSNEIIPKFIASSYDKNATIDFDSMMLKSLNKLISKYFSEPTLISKHVGDLPTGNLTLLSRKSKEKVTNHFTTNSNYKYTISLNEDKSKINIMCYKTLNQSYTEIDLYQIEIDNFVIENKAQFSLNKAIIKKKWSMSLPGMIKKKSLSNDKKSLIIAYKVTKGNVITYRLRYVNDINFYNTSNSENNEKILYKEYKKYLDRENSSKRFTFNFIQNDDEFSFDDFAIDGNTAINSISVDKDAIVYNRNVDYYRYVYLRKDNNNRQWNIIYKGEKTSDSNLNYIHTNSITFLSNKVLIRNELTVSQHGIYALVSSLHIKNDTVISKNILKYKINDNTLSQMTKESFSIEHSVKKINKYIKHTKFSNNMASSINGVIEEMNHGILYYISYDNKTDEVKSSLLSAGSEKVRAISADSTLENIIVQYSNNNFAYMNLNDSNSIKSDNDIEFPEFQGDHVKMRNIIFTSLPKRFRKQKILSFFIDKFDEKMVLFLLMEKGILLSLDFSDIVNRYKNGMWKSMLTECNYTILLIVLANFMTFGIYFKMCRRRGTTNATVQRRNQEINQVIHEMVRLNNTDNNNTNEQRREEHDNTNNQAQQNQEQNGNNANIPGGNNSIFEQILESIPEV